MKLSELINSWLSWKSVEIGERYTQKRLSIESGLHETTISLVMNGKTEPDTETLKKISKAIGISLSDFWAGPDKYELKRRSKQSQLDEFGGLARERPETQISENDIKRAEIMKLLMHVNDTSVLDYIIEYVEFKFVNEEKKRAVSNPKNHESETA